MGSSTAGRKKKKGTSKPKVSAASRHLAAAVLSSQDAALELFPCWRDHLADREFPRSAAEILPSESSPMLWGVSPDHQVREETRLLTKKLHALSATSVQTVSNDSIDHWCATSALRPDRIQLLLEAIAFSHALPQLATRVKPQRWQGLLEALVQLVQDGTSGSNPRSPWPSQLVGSELPIALAYNLPEIDAIRDQAQNATAFMSESITDLLDGSGMPEAPMLPLLRPLLACWLRCLTMIQATRKLKLPKATRKELAWLVRHALRLTRADGSQTFGRAGDLDDEFHLMIDAALVLFEDKSDGQLAAVVLNNSDVESKRLPNGPSYESEWAGVAVLQPEWSPVEPRLSTLFRHDTVHVELATQGHTLLSGTWDAQFVADGMPLIPQGDWGSVCWFSDFDVDYLELEVDLSHGWKVQRQFLMARQDHFLFTADALVGPCVADVNYRLRLPMVPGVKFEPAGETNEGFLSIDSPLALAIPLAAPEWTTALHPNGWVGENQAVELRQQTRGQRLYAPMFFDFHPRRLKKQCTWRQLTIGESLETCARDIAAGYRIQVGPEQWLAYRSLSQPANRTVLGQNLVSEFFFARFLTDGDTETIVEID